MDRNILDVSNKFKEILHKMDIDYKKAYLFGSRARNDYNPESDWDFLILTGSKMGGMERRKLSGELRMKFHDYCVKEPVDIILKDEKTFENEKNILNTIANEVFFSGREL